MADRFEEPVTGDYAHRLLRGDERFTDERIDQVEHLVLVEAFSAEWVMAATSKPSANTDAC